VLGSSVLPRLSPLDAWGRFNQLPPLQRGLRGHGPVRAQPANRGPSTPPTPRTGPTLWPRVLSWARSPEARQPDGGPEVRRLPRPACRSRPTAALSFVGFRSIGTARAVLLPWRVSHERETTLATGAALRGVGLGPRDGGRVPGTLGETIVVRASEQRGQEPPLAACGDLREKVHHSSAPSPRVNTTQKPGPIVVMFMSPSYNARVS
jgi:hypothetical protein